MKKTEEEGKTADTPTHHGHICMVDIMAENDKKRFYWLKLKKDFFQRHDIRIIESMPNGKDYVLFYLKLMCESTSHEGELRFSQYIPYSVEMLATITNTNVDVVKNAVAIFQDLHMMEILDDGTIFMNEVQTLIGSETGKAIRMKEYRERKLLKGSNEPTCSLEIEKEKDIEIEKDIEKEFEEEDCWEKQIDRIFDRHVEACLYDTAKAYQYKQMVLKASYLTGDKKLPIGKLEDCILKINDNLVSNPEGYLYQCFKNGKVLCVGK